MNLTAHVEQMRLRVVQDAFAEALSTTWHRRGDLLEWARPRRGDYHGRATARERALRDQALREAAEACRRRADVSLGQALDPELADLIVGES